MIKSFLFYITSHWNDKDFVISRQFSKLLLSFFIIAHAIFFLNNLKYFEDLFSKIYAIIFSVIGLLVGIIIAFWGLKRFFKLFGKYLENLNN